MTGTVSPVRRLAWRILVAGVLVIGLTAVTAVTAVTAGLAGADPDLRLHRAPPRMKMRAAAAPSATDTAPTAAADVAPREASADPAGAASGPADTDPPLVVTGFSPLPRSTRELAERVTFRLRAGLEVATAPVSGELLRGGAPLPSGFDDTRPWLLGDAVVGVRDMLVPSLGGYFLSSFRFDVGDSLPTRSALVTPGDAADQELAIKAGYLEWGNDDRRPQKLWLRGGRQFRLDGGAMFAYFDGVTAGYRANGVDASAFVGQRVVLYVNSEPGVTFGATAAADLQVLRGTPARIALDYLGLALSQPAGMPGAVETELRQLIALTGSYEPSSRLRTELRARIVDGDGGGLALGRVGGRLRFAPSDPVMVIADLEQRWGGDLAYDLAAPSAVDVVDTARTLGVGLAAPIDALTLGARVDLRRGNSELLVFSRVELPESTPVAVDQQGWFELGAAVAGQPVPRAWIAAQYTGRQYFRETAANQAGSAFDDTAGSGLGRLHELAVEATVRSYSRDGARSRIGAFYRIYDLVTPYRTAASDGRAGGRVDVSWWFSRTFRAEVAAEVAQSSPILARELGTMTSVRGALEARW